MKITFIGDIACDRQLLKASQKKGGYDFSQVFSKVKDIFIQSDFVVGNFETVCGGSNNNYQEQYMTCNAPDELVQAMKDAGISMVTTANNHCLDKGIKGLRRTIKCLNKNEIEYVGTNLDSEHVIRIKMKTISDVRIAFLAYTYSTNESNTGIVLNENNDYFVNLLRKQGRVDNPELKGQFNIKKYFTGKLSSKQKRTLTRIIARTKLKLGIPYMKPRTDKIEYGDTNNNYIKLVKNDIVEAKKIADIVVACPHFGGQFNTVPGEYAEFLMNYLKLAGCDIVIGNHPHVVQKIKMDDKKMFAYSLGSFNQSISADYMVAESKPEYSIMIHCYINGKSKKIQKISFSILKIVEDKEGMITVWPVDKLYRELSTEEKKLLISDINEIYQRCTANPLEKIDSEFSLYCEDENGKEII